MPKPLTTEEKVHRLLHPEKMTPEESEAASDRAADAYQWTVYEYIVAARYREKNLPETEQKEYLRRQGKGITFDGCECLREIDGEQRASGASRFFEFKFSGYTPGAAPAPDMCIRLSTVSGIKRFVLYQGHCDNRVTVEIDLEPHTVREVKLLRSGDTIEFLLPYKIGGQAIKRFRYVSARDARHLPAGEPAVFETLDGNFRDILPAWKNHLFWIAKMGRYDLQAHGFSAGNRQRAGGAAL